MALDITSYILGKAAGGGGDPHEAEYTAAAYDVCEEKGATMPAEETLANLADCIDTIPGATIIPPEAGTLTSLVVGTLPKISYVEGEALDLTGCEILGNYSNGYQFDVTQRCTFTCNDPVTYFDTAIVVSLDGVTLSIPITVAAAPVQAPAETKGLWHFDDGTDKNEVNGKGTSSSGLVNPASITAVTGKFSGGSSTTSFKYPGRYFNYNNSLQLSHSSYSELASAQITIECWFYCSGTTAKLCFGIVGTNGSADGVLGISVASSGVVSNISTTQLMPSPTVGSMTIDISKWHHFAFVNDQTTRKVFVDGNLYITSTAPTSSGNLGLKYIDNTNSSNTNIDEVLITESVKYAADFEPPHAPYYLASQGGE